MADIKINYQTGDIALPQQAGGFRIYKKGEYRFNQDNNQFAIPADQGGWEIHDAPAGAVKQSGILPMSELPTGDYQFDISAGIPGALVRGVMGPGDAAMGNIPLEQLESRAAETAMLMTGGPALVRGARMTAPLRGDVRGQVKPPTAEQLLSAGDAGFKAARGMGVDFAPPAVQTMVDDLLGKFGSEGFVAENHPAIINALNKLRNAPEVPDADVFINFNEMVGARDALKEIAGDFTNPKGQRWATLGINAIDDFLENPPPAAVASEAGVPGATQAGKLFEEANANYAAGKRSNALAGKTERAIDRAGATNSGQNFDNQLRQRIDEIIARPKERRGYTDEEIALMREVVRGTFGSNAARYVGNLLGGGGGLGAFITGAGTGMMTGQPGMGMAIGALAPLTGFIGKKTSAGLTGRQISLIDALTRSRSPLSQKMQKNAPMVPSGDARREALLRALVTYDSSQPWLRQPSEQNPQEFY